MTPMRTRCFALAIALAAVAPASAAETWDCAAAKRSGAPVTPWNATARIDGETLTLQFTSPEVGPGGTVMQLQDGKIPKHTLTATYRILANNAVGITAIDSPPPSVGPRGHPLVVSSTFLLKKSDGHLRIEFFSPSGSFGSDAHCSLISTSQAP